MTRRARLSKWLARAAYSLLFRVLAPAVLARAWWRGRAEPVYRAAFSERWGGYREPKRLRSSRLLWIHAVSLGETMAASPLIDALRVRAPALRLVLTHGTATGRAAGAELVREGDVQAWLPIDTPGAVARFLDHFAPVVGVLMETEIWPNLLHAAARRRMPMVLANGRLSERSQQSGRRVAWLLRPAFKSLDLVLAQSADDATRLQASGATEVLVAGNLKFDLEPDSGQMAQGRRWREWLASLGGKAPRGVVLAAVTREGEEAAMLDAWTKLAAPRPLLVIVPRHPQRFDEVAGLVQARGLVLARRSAWGDEPSPDAALADVWLGDSMREMALWYGMADVALLGGSFEPLGGQNLIEAAACGCPVVMGPHTFNFAAAAAGALEVGAARRVADVDAGVTAAVAMLEPAYNERRVERADAALAFAAAHRGAADRMAEDILARWSAAPVNFF